MILTRATNLNSYQGYNAQQKSFSQLQTTTMYMTKYQGDSWGAGALAPTILEQFEAGDKTRPMSKDYKIMMDKQKSRCEER